MKRLVLATAMAIFAMASSANAISLRFKFKTYSSGPSIYACNAGLKSAAVGKKVCYFEGTTNACTQNDCKDGQVCNTRCVCAGDNNGGDYLMNYGKVTTMTWADHGETPVVVESNKTFASTNQQYAQAISSDAAAFNHTIKDLSFNLGSELYNAEYFVDICFRAPQIEYYLDGVNSNWAYTLQATATDFIANGINPGDNSRAGLDIPAAVAGKKYSTLAGLTVEAKMVCDLQGEGVYKYANVDGSYNTSVNEADIAGVKDIVKTHGAQSLAGNAVDFVKGASFTSGTKAPRFCKIRYTFKETNGRSSLPLFRKWQRHGAEICTFTDITEGEVASELQ